jgi:hypothetical protein
MDLYKQAYYPINFYKSDWHLLDIIRLVTHRAFGCTKQDPYSSPSLWTILQ